VIDPFQPYATAAARSLPDARLVVDHFHVVRLANAALDEVRRRVQHTTLGHRGHKNDPLYRIRRRLLTGPRTLGPGRLRPACRLVGRRRSRWRGRRLLLGPRSCCRETFAAGDVFAARRRLTAFCDHCAASEVAELERLTRTIARWETPILRWHRTGLTNAATEGTNLIVKNIKRLGFGFRNFDNYRLRLLLRCGAPCNITPSHQYDPRHPRISA
jgi:transposase